MKKENKEMVENSGKVLKTFMVRGDIFPDFEEKSIYQYVNSKLVKDQINEKAFNEQNRFVISRLFHNRMEYILDLALKDACLRYTVGDTNFANILYNKNRCDINTFGYISLEEIAYNNIDENKLIDKLFYAGMDMSEQIFNSYLNLSVTPLDDVEEQKRTIILAQEIADIYNMVYLKLAVECYIYYAPLYNPEFKEQYKGLTILNAYFNSLKHIKENIPAIKINYPNK